MKRRRISAETAVTADLSLSPGAIEVRTGIGFLDHLFRSLAFHAGWGLSLSCEGDLEVDDHHSAEDCALLLGACLREALEATGPGEGSPEGAASGQAPRARFGCAYAPLDEALARAVVDCSGRPWASVELGLARQAIGGLAAENAGHALSSFALAAGICLHVEVLKGINDHHRAEAAFKAVALALREALAPCPAYRGRGQSCKGTVSVVPEKEGERE